MARVENKIWIGVTHNEIKLMKNAFEIAVTNTHGEEMENLGDLYGNVLIQSERDDKLNERINNLIATM